LYAPLQLKRGSFIKNSSTLIMDYVCLIIPVLLACTLESFSWSWLIMQSLVSGLKWVYQWQSSKEKSSPAKGKTGQLTDQQRKSNLFSVFRGSLQFATICAILAVDFPVFPRKFAKTETFGYSLMDTGVGAFVLSSGLVSGPRLLSKTASEISIWKSSKSTFFVFLIGLGRMISTKFVGYQEHITEYGTHWNFFFTLGLVPFIVALQTKILNGLPFVLCAGSIMLGKCLLSHEM
jgi:phosphatidylinositol glycan class W